MLNWATFLWLLVLAIFAGQQIIKGRRHSVYFVLPVFFMFCGLPLFLDEIFGRPGYLNKPGFALASADETTGIIYCLYMALVPVILLCFGKPKLKMSGATTNSGYAPRGNRSAKQKKTRTWIICWMVLLSPIVLVCLSPLPAEYLTFSDTLRFSDSYDEFHTYVTLASNLAALAGAYLIAVSTPRVPGRWPRLGTLAAVTVFMLLAVWIHGKRNIVVIMAVLALMALHHRGLLKGVRAAVLIVASLIVVFGYSFFFQVHTERVSTTWYENVRMDFGRDDAIKMTLFAELNPEVMRILEYRGQSLVFLVVSYVPRKLWPEKPLPYAQYFTSALFLSSPRMWGWGMTTSWLEEAIANFSWLGMLLGPLCIALVCRAGDASGSVLGRILTPLVACLLMLVHAIAFFPLLLLWFYVSVTDSFRNHKVDNLRRQNAAYESTLCP
ncbi:MAG: hypothetical protein JW937_07515 [Candidatus Omnitrophica bacterium]|nr:hypothetical protein [Candidatus Omnitrophota bacterium]